jgi:signal transduction histidine kinase
VGQALAISKIKLGVLKSAGGCDEYLAMVEEVRKLVEQAIRDTRSLIFEISSPILYELGFEAALEWLAEQVQKNHGIDSTYEDDGTPKPLDDDIRALLYQAAGELLINAAKHAHPKHIKVESRREGSQIRVSVEDDGVGFQVSGTCLIRGESEGLGFGLFSIRERLNYVGGRLEISSSCGVGTSVTLVAPLKRN